MEPQMETTEKSKGNKKRANNGVKKTTPSKKAKIQFENAHENKDVVMKHEIMSAPGLASASPSRASGASACSASGASSSGTSSASISSPTSASSKSQHFYVKYNDDKNARITAIAACEIPYTEKKEQTPPNSSQDHEMFMEKCAFTLEYLADCDGIGILLQSETKTGSLKWNLVCRPDISFDPSEPVDVEKYAVHRFDITMLKKFIDIHGANFLKCPLCKQGSKKKKDVQEHDIDTMAQLKQKREAQKKTDLQMCFFTEGLMLRKACEETAQHPEAFATVAKEVLQHWASNGVLESFQASIQSALEQAIIKDHRHVMVAVLQNSIKLWNREKHETFFVLACKHESVTCMKYLMEHYDCPIDKYGKALLEIVKHGNIELIDYLVKEMKQTKEKEERVYILHDVFREVVMKDMESVARTIIENRWHRPNQSDIELANKLEGQVAMYLESRSAPIVTECFDDDDDLTLDDWDAENGEVDMEGWE